MNVIESVKVAIEKIVPYAETVVPAEKAGEGEEQKPDTVLHSAGARAVDFATTGCSLDVLCNAERIAEVARALDGEKWFIESIAGVDWLKDDQLEVVYTFSHFHESYARVMVRLRVPRSEPKVPTISDVFSGADWHERETFDFYGIEFVDHPNLIRILLPEDADFYPLRKDYMP